MTPEQREHRREVNRRACASYRTRHPKRIAKIQKRYRNKPEVREKRLERLRVWRLAHPDYAVDRRKTAVGRVCESCDENDSTAMWSVTSARHCNTCYCRGQRNGWCLCGAAFYRIAPKASRATGRVVECRAEACTAGTSFSKETSTLWDLHWCAQVKGTVTWETVARVYGSVMQTAKQQLYRLWPKFEALRIDATWVEGHGRLGTFDEPVPSAIVFDPVLFERVVGGRRDVG